MPRFKNLSASSEGGGFQYYKVVDYSFTKAGAFYAKFVGVYNHNTSTFAIPKNTPGLILTNVLMNISTIDTPGRYFNANGGRNGNQIIGSSGGFPIFYNYNVFVYQDANNLYIALDVGNGSAVNDVNAPAITLSGKVFFYLAPF